MPQFLGADADRMRHVVIAKECEDFCAGFVREFAQRPERITGRQLRRSAPMSAEYISFAKISGAVILTGLHF